MGPVYSRVLQWNESNSEFVFQKLPEVCQVRIFSFLSVTEKGVAAQVCKEWNSLVKSPVLWNHLDLTEFGLHSPNRVVPCQHLCDSSCYKRYKAKINSFHSFIANISPSIHFLSFEFDVGDTADGWLDWLKSLLLRVRCKELTKASVGWKETTVKPKDGKACREDDSECISRMRHRQRHFVGFFEHFVSLAPNISHLEIEFDWSVRSVNALSKLRCLEKLVLKRYFVYQSLDQSLVDKLLDSLPCLRYLEMEVWTPNSTGLSLYTLKSNTLQHLDVAECRGFYLSHLHLPRLQDIQVGHRPWSGPLVTVDCTPLPCLYHVLVRGTPSLEHVNGRFLRPEWTRNLYPELNSVLDDVCPCHLHKPVSSSCIK